MKKIKKINPHKGGRTTRIYARVTPEEKSLIFQKCRDSKMSLADWIVNKAKEQSISRKW